MAGFVWFPPRAGVLERMPERCPLDRVCCYETKAEIGASYTGARSVADHIARAFVSGSADEDLEPKLDALDAWWNEQCVWGFDDEAI